MGDDYFFKESFLKLFGSSTISRKIPSKVKVKFILVLWRAKNEEDLVSQIAYCQVRGRELLSYGV